jgi:hypothetical protein
MTLTFGWGCTLSLPLIPSSHLTPWYPGWHPSLQVPLMWWHCLSSWHLPHVWLQSGPYWLSPHTLKKTKYQHRLKHFISSYSSQIFFYQQTSWNDKNNEQLFPIGLLRYKSENGRARASEYIRGGIRCHGGVSIPCWSVTPVVSPFSRLGKRCEPHSRSVSRTA